MPLVQKKITDFFQKDPYLDLNPEEVVAQGAALQSEIIKGKVKDLLLQKNKRQITTSDISDTTVERIKQLIQAEHADCTITSPMNKL